MSVMFCIYVRMFSSVSFVLLAYYATTAYLDYIQPTFLHILANSTTCLYFPLFLIVRQKVEAVFLSRTQEVTLRMFHTPVVQPFYRRCVPPLQLIGQDIQPRIREVLYRSPMTPSTTHLRGSRWYQLSSPNGRGEIYCSSHKSLAGRNSRGMCPATSNASGHAAVAALGNGAGISLIEISICSVFHGLAPSLSYSQNANAQETGCSLFAQHFSIKNYLLQSLFSTLETSQTSIRLLAGMDTVSLWFLYRPLHENSHLQIYTHTITDYTPIN